MEKRREVLLNSPEQKRRQKRNDKASGMAETTGVSTQRKKPGLLNCRASRPPRAREEKKTKTQRQAEGEKEELKWENGVGWTEHEVYYITIDFPPGERRASPPRPKKNGVVILDQQAAPLALPGSRKRG